MGKDLAENFTVARQTFDEADDALGFKLSELCFQGPEDQLKLTENTQPAILTVSVAAARVLEENGIRAGAAGGHSLGEYSAHVAAGTLAFRDAVQVVRNRGRYMQQAVPVGTGAMAAILGLNAVRVAEICAEAAQGEVVSPANINSPEQTVISGYAAAVSRACDLAKNAGAKRAILLPVSAPFHCALMQPAQDRLAADLAALSFSNNRIPVVRNIDGHLCRPGDGSARDALIRQVTGTVQWVKCIDTLVREGSATFIEVGPGRVLAGLMRQIDKSLNVVGVQDAATLQTTLSALGVSRSSGVGTTY